MNDSQVQAPNNETSEKIVRYSNAEVEIGSDYLALQGQDPADGTTGRLLSGLSPKAYLSWQQIWSEKVVVGNLRVQGSTDCTLGNGAGGTNCSSDIRLKDDVQEIENLLTKIQSLRGVEFKWNEKSQSPGRHDIGVIAQDVEKVFPTAVIDDPNTGYKKVDYAVLVAPIIEAFKDIQKRLEVIFETSDSHSRLIASLRIANDKKDKEITTLKAKSEKLEKENADIKARLERLEKLLQQK